MNLLLVLAGIEHGILKQIKKKEIDKYKKKKKKKKKKIQSL